MKPRFTITPEYKCNYCTLIHKTELYDCYHCAFNDLIILRYDNGFSKEINTHCALTPEQKILINECRLIANKMGLGLRNTGLRNTTPEPTQEDYWQ